MKETDNRRRNILVISGFLVIILIMIVAMLLRSFNTGDEYTSDIVLSYIELPDSSNMEFYNYRDGFIKVRQDGTEAIDSSGKKLWNISYDAVNPIADVCGNCAVIADRGNRNLFVTDGTGEQTKITTEYAIVDVEIAKQGVTAVWTSNADEDIICVFDINGKKLLEIVTGIIKEGSPIDISISDDGQKMAASYLTVEGTEVKNWVTLYNFGEVGQNYTDKVVGSFTYKEAFVPKVEFLTDNNLCVYKDNGFVLYKMKELPELIYEETVDDTIYSLITGTERILMVTGAPNSVKKRLRIYDLQGKLLTDVETDVQYTRVVVFEDSYALTNEREINLFYISGERKYFRNTQENLRLLVECDTDEYIIVQEKRAEIIELGNDKSVELTEEVEY